MYKLFLLIIFTFLFTACSQKDNNVLMTIDSYEIQSASLLHTNLEKEKNDLDYINKKLYEFYSEWKGVKYKYGGTTKNGIDCSAFIQKAFKDKFDLNIPRTTIDQVKIGKEVERSELNIGDLVFFRTGRNSRHVGIYLRNGQFMHSSTKKGVTISSLSNRYYNTHFWKAQRIID